MKVRKRPVIMGVMSGLALAGIIIGGICTALAVIGLIVGFSAVATLL